MKYPRYPKYKDSGVEWMGEVPEGWEKWKLSHAFETIGSGTTPKSDIDLYYDGNIPWVTTSELREEEIFKTNNYITELALADCSALKIYPKGTLLIAMYGATIGRLGLLAIEATCNQACCALAIEIQLSSRFIFFWLQGMRSVLLSFASGGGQPNLSQEFIRSIVVPAPPKSEQKNITDFLDHNCVKIDALIAEQEKLIALLKEKRRAVISHAVTKGLNPDAPMKDSGVEWIGEVPNGWETLTIRRITECLDGKRIPLNSEQRYGKIGNIPYWGANSIVDYIDEALFDETLILLGEDGAPFNDKTKQVAFFSQGPIWPNNHVHTLRPSQDIDAKYIVYLLNITEFGFYINGSTREKLTQSEMNNIVALMPPLPEQHSIATFLDAETAKIDALIAESEKAVALLKERRGALISAAVTGKIDVRDIPLKEAV